VRSIIQILINPEKRRPAPQPRQVDLRQTIFIGMGAWCVAIIVLLILGAVTDLSVGNNLRICGTGLTLGILALGWEHTNRRRYRAVAETVDVIDDKPSHEESHTSED
jgi:hypothetical protein